MRFFAAALILAAASPAFSQTQDPGADQWRAWAVGDVEAATKIFSTSHPGMFDPHNPSFPDQVKRAHETGLAAAEETKDAAGLSRALSIFSAAFRDGHAQAFSTDTLPSEWPGLVAARRGTKTWIIRSTVPGIPKSAEILSCDGVPVDNYIRDHVFKTMGRPAEAGQWFHNTPSLLARSAATAADRPSRCRLRMPNGSEVDEQLHWAKTPDKWFEWRRLASDGEPNPLTLSEPAPGIFHVGLSDFSPNADGLKAWDRLLADLKQRDGDLRQGRAIILDLRYNNGGSSNWPTLVAEQLWGKEATDTARDNYFKGVEIWWLAEPTNIGRFENREAELRKIGDKTSANFVHTAIANLKGAVSRGDRFYVDRDPPGKVFPPSAPPRPLPPVYVVMPPSCASACLDAVDIFQLFPNVTLIGAPTSGDSTYLEVVQQELPSGHAKVVIPTKVWVNRRRGSGEVYFPKITVTDLDWNEQAFVATVERDLAARSAKVRAN